MRIVLYGPSVGRNKQLQIGSAHMTATHSKFDLYTDHFDGRYLSMSSRTDPDNEELAALDLCLVLMITCPGIRQSPLLVTVIMISRTSMKSSSRTSHRLMKTRAIAGPSAFDVPSSRTARCRTRVYVFSRRSSESSLPQVWQA